MYSRRKVAARVAEAESEFQFTLVEHSPAEIDEFREHLRKTAERIDGDGKLTYCRPFEPWEQQFIFNEKIMVSCDALYWMTRYAYVSDEANIIRRFTLRVPQELFFSIICDLENLDAPIEIQNLKARQLGSTTLIELIVSHRISFFHGVNAVIASADKSKTPLMAKKLFLAYDEMPEWIKPRWTRRVESDNGLLEFDSIKSGVSFQHGSQMSGISRGSTPTIYHLSEVASFTNPEAQIEASLLRAVHASPNVFGVLESTAEGDAGWWPETWRTSKELWPKGRSRFCPLFLPWYVGTDIYPTPTWIRVRPIPLDWVPLDDTRRHVAAAELYVRSHPLLKNHLGKDWRMPLKQQWFWEVEHEQAKRKGTEATFYQEMAGDDVSCFINSFDSVFGREVIAEVDSRRMRDYKVYGIVGQSIEDRHEPSTDDIDYTLEREIVSYRSPRGDSWRWELVPLSAPSDADEESQFDPDGKLIVFFPPQPGVDYSIGIDTSNGIGQDSTCISVVAVGKNGLPDVQVAEYRSRHVSHVEAFAPAMAISSYYARHMGDGYGGLGSGPSPYREPLVGIEQIRAVGDTCQLQMRKLGYSRFHQFQRYDAKDLRKKKATRLGWFTTGWSRPILCDGFVVSVQNGWCVVNSPWTIYEMSHWEVHYTASGKEKKEHASGEHDDGIFALAIATHIAHDMETMTERSSKKCEATLSADDTLPPLDLAPIPRCNVPSNGSTRMTMEELLG